MELNMSTKTRLMTAAGLAAMLAGATFMTQAVAQATSSDTSPPEITSPEQAEQLAHRPGAGRFGPGGFGPGRFGRGGPGGPGGGNLAERFDTNSDGQITAAEIDAAKRTRLAEFDTDGNGVLSLEEYEALWLQRTQRRMVASFQRLDDDGNATVTLDEFGPNSDRIVERLDRDGDGVIGEDEQQHRRFHRHGRGGPAQ